MICPNCQKDHQKLKFCSKSCSATFNNKNRKPRSQESKELTSKTLTGRPSPLKGRKTNRTVWPRTPIERKSCKCCGSGFWAKGKWDGKVTCSPECARKNQTYRKIAIPYEHNGETILLESSWELDIANWLTEHNITWSRPKHIVWVDSTGKQRKYFPDFYLHQYDLYLDPKNDYQIKIGQEKINSISNIITLIYGRVEYIKQEVLKYTLKMPH